jgi:transcriptional regulator with XRE-family HTH domain
MGISRKLLELPKSVKEGARSKLLERSVSVYDMGKKAPRTLPRETLARNLRYIMKIEKLSEEALAKKAGVSQKQINNILNRQHAATIDTLDKIAAAFGLTNWQLMLPNLPDDLISSPSIAKLYKSYINSSDEGRELIDRLAEREAHYKTRK